MNNCCDIPKPAQLGSDEVYGTHTIRDFACLCCGTTWSTVTNKEKTAIINVNKPSKRVEQWHAN